MDTFTVSGSIDGSARTVVWMDGAFDDPALDGRLGDLIARKETVGLTVTGPWYLAASKPAETALATALAAFDDRNVVLDEAAQAIVTAALDDVRAPDGVPAVAY